MKILDKLPFSTRKLITFLVIGVAILGILNIILSIHKSSMKIDPGSLTKIEVKTSQRQFRLDYFFDGQIPTFDEEISVYTYPAEEAFSSQDAISIARALGIEDLEYRKIEVLSTLYTFNDHLLKRSMTVTDFPQEISFSDYSIATQDQNEQAQTSDFYAQRAQEVLDRLSIPQAPYTLSSGKISPLGESEIGLVETSYQRANIISVEFDYLLDGKVVRGNQQRTPGVVLFFYLNGELNRAIIHGYPTQLDALGTAKLANSLSAYEALKKNAGTIAMIYDPNKYETELQPGELKQVRLVGLELVYLFDDETRTLQPFYSFTGYATNKKQERHEVTVLISALEEELFGR